MEGLDEEKKEAGGCGCACVGGGFQVDIRVIKFSRREGGSRRVDGRGLLFEKVVVVLFGREGEGLAGVVFEELKVIGVDVARQASLLRYAPIVHFVLPGLHSTVPVSASASAPAPAQTEPEPEPEPEPRREDST